ncbi:hypothetical protein [Pontibacter beigongshangensis]|uniref:hypothetical protein n=1 Tax=Pontibacter beigongshangensis TaxID=2574733 RepID=UPI001650B627|nr:hypothetical protein [Pontibacter beigongshangensis]
MKPEEVDKLFKARLGNSSSTPPADLWNRLQERIETEMPQPEEEEKKPVFILWYRSYGIAAAVALLLAAGLVFFSLRNNQADQAPAIAQTETPAPARPVEIAGKVPADNTEVPATVAIPEAGTAETPAAAAQPEAAPAKAIASTTPATKAAPKPAAVKRVEPLTPSEPAPALAATQEQETPATTLPDAPVALAAAPKAESQERVQIIIKRAMAPQAVAVQHEEQEVELSSREKKQQLAKSIFKQVKNLATGERVELSELGVRTEQIALETQIGKQKFSKVINL